MTRFTVRLSEMHVREFVQRTNWTIGQLVWLIVLIVLLCVFALVGAVGEDSFDLLRFLAILLGGLVALALFLVLRRYLRNRTIEAQVRDNPYLKYENTFTFENPTLSYANEVSSLKISLDQIRKVTETKSLLIVLITRTSALLLPKDQMPEDLRSLLTSRTKRH